MDLSIFKSPSYHIHNIKIHSYDIDFNKRVNLFSLFNYFQEIAWEHAANLHFGLEDLSKQNLFWVLSRVRLEIERLPQWNENITLITYPRGIDGLFALRDYEIYDSTSNRIVSCTSSWLILSAQTRKPIRLADLDLKFVTNERKATIIDASKVANAIGGPVCIDSLAVKSSDIDINQHVNNARYVEWAYNTFPVVHCMRNVPKIVEVNFIAECKYGSKIDIEQYRVSDNESLVTIKRIEDQRELCRLYFEWQAE